MSRGGWVGEKNEEKLALIGAAVQGAYWNTSFPCSNIGGKPWQSQKGGLVVTGQLPAVCVELRWMVIADNVHLLGGTCSKFICATVFQILKNFNSILVSTPKFSDSRIRLASGQPCTLHNMQFNAGTSKKGGSDSKQWKSVLDTNPNSKSYMGW